MQVGTSGQNQGITALSARADPLNANRYQVFARVRNFADQPYRGTLVADGGRQPGREPRRRAAAGRRRRRDRRVRLLGPAGRRADRRGEAGRHRRLPGGQQRLHRPGRRAALRDPAGDQRQRLPGEGAQPAADRRGLAGGAAPLPRGGREPVRRGGLRRLRAGRAAARQRADHQPERVGAVHDRRRGPPADDPGLGARRSAAALRGPARRGHRALAAGDAARLDAHPDRQRQRRR